MGSVATERGIRLLRAEVLQQIEYDSILTVDNRELLDELVELMVEVLSSRRETLSISGEERPTWLVQERLRKLNAHHIEYVLDCLRSNRTKVHNIKKAGCARSHFRSRLALSNVRARGRILGNFAAAGDAVRRPDTMDKSYENHVRHAGIV